MSNFVPPKALPDAMRSWLETMKDDGTEIDSGGGLGSRDFWVKIDGVEYFVSVRWSNAERMKAKGELS